MSSRSTKAVSFRVPMDSYTELIQEAKECSLSITDLLYSKIFKQEKQSTNDETQELREKIRSLELELSHAYQTIQSLNTQNKELSNTLDRVCSNFKNDLSEIISENKQLKELSSKVKDYEDEINQLTGANSNLVLEIGKIERRELLLYGIIFNLEKIAQEVDEYREHFLLKKVQFIDSLEISHDFDEDDTDLNRQMGKMDTSQETYSQSLQSDKYALDLINKIEALKKDDIETINKLSSESEQDINTRKRLFSQESAISTLYDRYKQQIINLHE